MPALLRDREAGSFVRFAIDTYGLDRVLSFFRASSRTDSLDVIRERFAMAIGVSLEAAEAAWLEVLRAR
ncbi:MAG TPA: hypothetical protein VD833_21495 [Vicinamibacterales bacterium]|nr:hypothetical protein [Vicinamibacterales bacterium]